MGVPPMTTRPLPEGQRAQTEARPGRKARTEVRTVERRAQPARTRPGSAPGPLPPHFPGGSRKGPVPGSPVLCRNSRLFYIILHLIA